MMPIVYGYLVTLINVFFSDLQKQVAQILLLFLIYNDQNTEISSHQFRFLKVESLCILS
jgi:hypothetical protein